MPPVGRYHRPVGASGSLWRGPATGRNPPRRLRKARNTLVRCGYSRPGGCSPLLETLQEAITTLIGDYGYVAIFVLMVLESACIPIPSEVTMLFGGALASPGFAAPGHELDLVVVALMGTLGNLVGSWLAYGIGAAGGRPLVDRFGRYLLILPHEVDRAHEWFERRGELTVFVTRLLPVIRTFISLPAGVARMPFWRFTIYTVLGCLPWTFALAWLGYLLGENWAKVEEFLQPVAWGIVVVLAIGLVWYVARRYRRVRAAYAELDATSGGGDAG